MLNIESALIIVDVIFFQYKTYASYFLDDVNFSTQNLKIVSALDDDDVSRPQKYFFDNSDFVMEIS